MSSTAAPIPPEIHYPESDGKPMADNTLQFIWITVLYHGLAALFRDRGDVFVCGNQFWYPVEGSPEICNAPDVYVVFGRPKGHRSSYKQWQEGGVPMTVVFEVLSPENDYAEMIDKQMWYEEHGVEEYYVFDPEAGTLVPHLRTADMLRPVRFTHEFVSPRLGVRFDLSGKEMVVHGPDGRRFLTAEEIAEDRELAEQRADKAEQRADKAEQLAARLADLTRKLLAGQATDEEKDELARLAAPPSP